MVALVAALPFSLVSCGDDDEGGSGESGSLRGQVTMKDGTNAPSTYYAYYTHWNAGHQQVTGSVLNYLKSGATFVAYFSETKLSSFEAEMICGNHDGHIQIETPDEIKEGAEISIDKCMYESPYNTDSYGYFSEECTGKVTVKSIRGNVITLQFKDFKFDYISAWHVGNSTFRNIVMNGEISFPVEE